MATLVDYALTTVDDVKESLGVASSDHSWDNLITRKINFVTDMIQKYTGRTFKLQQYTENKDGSNIDQFVLDQRPVVFDADHDLSVTRRSTSLNDDNDFETIPADLTFLDADAGLLNLDYVAHGHWDRYQVSYWAGYSTLPNDLVEAANTLACYYVLNPTGANVGVMTKKEGQREVRFSNTNNTLSFANIAQQLGVNQVLDSYANNPILTSN